MPPLLRFLIRRSFAALLSLLIITMILYAGVMLTPAEARVSLFLPPGKGGERTTETRLNVLIEQYHLDDPYLVQYGTWLKSLFTGSWGYSPTFHEDVLPALQKRMPATLELAAYSLLFLIPIGLASGLIAGWKKDTGLDQIFKGAAFLGASIPPIILAICLLAVFYIDLGWFAPGRIDTATYYDMVRTDFVHYTGALTIDSLLNHRLDIFAKALRHMVMPGVTLSLFHWATLSRVTRSLVIEQRDQEYITAARGRGLAESRILFRHALRPILAPALTTMAFSAASIVTSIYVVEIIYGLSGVTQLIVKSISSTPDASTVLGFAVYSVLMVIGLMLLLDLAQAIFDPRIRNEVFRR